LFVSKKEQEGGDVKEVSLVYAIHVVVVFVVFVTIKQCSKLLKRVRMLYKVQRVYSCQCWYNRNTVDFKGKHRILSGLLPEGVKKSTYAKRVKVKLSHGDGEVEL
jgi:hypothetical protein